MKKILIFFVCLFSLFISYSFAQSCSTNSQGNYHCTYSDGHYEYWNTNGSHYDSRTNQLDWINATNISTITNSGLSIVSCPGDSTLGSDGKCYCIGMNEDYGGQCIKTSVVGICKSDYYGIDIETDPALGQCTRHPEIYPAHNKGSCLPGYTLNSRGDRCLKDIGNSLKTTVQYTQELSDAYNYALKTNITTQSSIGNADMYGNLLRSHMAKMITNYAINVLGKKPNTSISCNFTDIYKQSSELQGYIKQACQLGLMGVGLTKFNPNGMVTRAEFGTILSRALWGDQYDGGNPYYKNHLQALKNVDIMNNISNPSSLEIRGYVMLMMQRSEGKELTVPLNNVPSSQTPEQVLACALGLDTCQNTINANDTIVYNNNIFEIEYPKSWSYESMDLDEDGYLDTIGFYKSEDIFTLLVTRVINDYYMTLDDFYEEAAEDLSSGDELLSIQDFIFNGLNAKKVLYKSLDGDINNRFEIIFVVKDGVGYGLSYDPNSSDYNTIQQIIKTFSIIE